MENCEQWQYLCRQCRDAQTQALISLMDFKDKVDSFLQKQGKKPSYEEFDKLKIYMEYENSARKKLLEFVIVNQLLHSD